jgi:prophage antirepressor-like protein|nr:MAG TPA: hypothetical protein [Caudoviricetes sp.]
MTNEISIFNFKSTPVRTSTQDGEVWFCLVDVCDSLNLKRGSRVIDRLSEKGVRKTYTLTKGGKQETIFINESNLYKLIFKSNKPAAIQFGDWVTGEVLPTIRKTGGYGAVDMKAIGGMVKRCVNKALSDFLSNELPIAEDEDVLRKKYYNVNDREMMDVFQRWYWSRNYDVRKVIDSQQQRIEELETKLRMVKQAIN